MKLRIYNYIEEYSYIWFLQGTLIVLNFISLFLSFNISRPVSFIKIQRFLYI